MRIAAVFMLLVVARADLKTLHQPTATQGQGQLENDLIGTIGGGEVATMTAVRSETTVATASSMDAVSDWMREKRWGPSIRTLPPYYEDEAYLGALAKDLQLLTGSKSHCTTLTRRVLSS